VTFDHENPLCASLGHYVGVITVVWCPHRSEWLCYVRVGDDADDVSWRSDRLAFGPFDSHEEVVAQVTAETQRVLRADHQAYLARRTARGHAPPTTER
jgi:hypothetical protein